MRILCYSRCNSSSRIVLRNIERFVERLPSAQRGQDNSYSMAKPRNSFRHGPFLTYLKRLDIRNSDCCGYPLHYATSCLFTTSYHLTKPSADLEPLWWKRVRNNNNFYGENQKTHPLHRGKRNTLFSKRWRQQQLQTQLTLGTPLLSSPIHKAPPSQIQQYKDLKELTVKLLNIIFFCSKCPLFCILIHKM
ncbi:hypothetical protein AVEN_98671-1 [Araneus ventricosus]|uniref:Uncharacterized protein n=1 Tax=Araneus ventricosus TaxID=182803 RepID=A0A4Y2RU09_ARAVE|nr:hypothetical protein AVEN_98671-1 [Araneus ventricosus]